MIPALIIGTIVGFVISIPPGPVTATIVAQSLRSGYRRLVPFVIGVSLCEIAYALAAVVGASIISGLLMDILNAVGVILLLGLGIRYTFFDINHLPVQRPLSVAGGFALGLIMPLSTPTLGASYVAIAGILYSTNVLGNNVVLHSAFAVGAGVGTIMWLSVIGMTFEKLRQTSGANLVRTTMRCAGVSLLVAAIVVGKNFL